MKTTGIIAEFNPLHNGHKYILDCAKQSGDAVIVAMSGNFTQRGDTAIIDKFKRASSSILSGASLVVEIPTPWAMSTAQNFALGGVSILKSLGTDTLLFGSESKDIAPLISAADTLSTASFGDVLKKHLDLGVTFASARQRAAEEISGISFCGVLDNPNNILGVEYILAARKLNYTPKIKSVTRKNALHDSSLISDGFASAKQIRELIKNGKTEDITALVPSSSLEILLSAINSGHISDLKKADTAIVSFLKRLSEQDLASLPDISEGIEKRIYKSIRENSTLEDIVMSAKTKRYTYSRIKRIILSAYLSVDNRLFGQEVPFIRVLAFDKKGQEIIKKASKTSPVPIIVRATDSKKLNSSSLSLFEEEILRSDLYSMTLDNPYKSGWEYTVPIPKF